MVEFYEDESGEWRWRLKAMNGQIIATGEGHTREADALRAFLRAAKIMEEAYDKVTYRF
jgi:uncharacterized protein YegP (UPF0339 family)